MTAAKSSGWNRTDGQPYAPDPIMPSSWDALLAREQVTEEEAIRNPRIRTWVQQHHRGRYVPTEVLRMMGLESPQ